MAWRPPKPANRSKIGFFNRSVYYVGNNDASINLGLSDALYQYDIVVPEARGYYAIREKEAGVPIRGDRIYLAGLNGTIILYLRNAVGGLVSFTSPANSFRVRERFLLTVWLDRDDNVYMYVNDVLVHFANISALSAIDEDNVGGCFWTYSSVAINYIPPIVYGFSFYKFGIGSIPDFSTRERVIDQYLANPYDVPSLLSSRPAYLTEEGTRVTFDNLDPSSILIRDESAYANIITIAGGLTVGQTCKELSGA